MREIQPPVLLALFFVSEEIEQFAEVIGRAVSAQGAGEAFNPPINKISVQPKRKSRPNAMRASARFSAKATPWRPASLAERLRRNSVRVSPSESQSKPAFASGRRKRKIINSLSSCVSDEKKLEISKIDMANAKSTA